MDKELQILLDEARKRGASTSQLDDILARYNAKKKEKPEEPFQFGASDTESVSPSQETKAVRTVKQDVPEINKPKNSFLEWLADRPVAPSVGGDIADTRTLMEKKPSLVDVLKENPEYGNKMVNRSVAAAQIGIIMSEAEAGLRSIDFEEVADLQKIIDYNQPKEGDFFYNDNEGFVGFMYDLARTLPESFISMGAAAETPITVGSVAVGAGTGSVVPGLGTATGAGAGFAFATSAINEYGTTIMSLLDEAGVDIRDKDAIEAAFADEDVINEIKLRAGKRAGIIGLLDAISGGVSGKIAKKTFGKVGSEVIEEIAGKGADDVVKEATKLTRRATGVEALETAIESSFGGAGEALGSLAAGQEVSMRDVLLETFADPTSKVISTGGRKAQSLITGIEQDPVSSQFSPEQRQMLKFAKQDPERFSAVINAVGYANNGEIKQINAKIAALKESSPAGKDKAIDKLIGDLQKRKAELQLNAFKELAGATTAEVAELGDMITDINDLNAKYASGELTGEAQSAVKAAIEEKLAAFNEKYGSLTKAGAEAAQTAEADKAPEFDYATFSEEDQAKIAGLQDELRKAADEKDTKKQADVSQQIIDIENKYRDTEKEAGVPSGEQAGKAPIQEQPVQEGGVEAPAAGRVVQKAEEVASKAVEAVKEPTPSVPEEAQIKPEDVVSEKDAQGNERFFAAYPVKDKPIKAFFEVKTDKDGNIIRVSDKSYGPARKTLKKRLQSETVAKKQIAEPVLNEVADAKVFSNALSEAKDELSKDERRLDLQVSAITEKEAQKIIDDGGKVFMTPDGLAGGYVTSDGYIGGIFKDPRSKAKGVAGQVIKQSIENGGKYLDAYGTELENIYIKQGFRPVARVPFAEEYADKGWDDPKSVLKEKPDVVFFVYDPANAAGTAKQGEVINDYDKAKALAAKTATEISEKQAQRKKFESETDTAPVEEIDAVLLEKNGATKKGEPRGKVTAEFQEEGILFKTTEDTGPMKDKGGEMFVPYDRIDEMPNVNNNKKSRKNLAEFVMAMEGIADVFKISPEERLRKNEIKVENLSKETKVSKEDASKIEKLINNFNKNLNALGLQPYTVKFFNGTYAAEYADSVTNRGKTRFKALHIGGLREIVINTDKATPGTVAHEMLHAYLAQIKLDPKKVVQFANIIEKELLNGTKEEIALALELKRFRDSYVEDKIYGSKTKDDPKIAEEFLAEYIGEIVSSFDDIAPKNTVSLAQKLRNAIVKFLAKVGIVDKNLVAQINDKQEAVDFVHEVLNVIQGRVTAPKDVPSGILRKDIDTNDGLNFSIIKGDFEHSYFQDSKEYQKLVDDGKIVHNSKLGNISNKAATITQPDSMVTAEIKLDGKTIVDGNGGVFFIAKFGDVWAAAKKSAANALAKMINDSRAKNGGKGYLLLTSGSLSKMISSTDGVKAAMNILESMVERGYISTSEFRTALTAVGKKYDIDFSGRDSMKSIHKDIQDKFLNVSDSTFQKRGFFFEDVVDHLAKNSTTAKENIQAIRDMLGSKKRISFSKQGIKDAIGYILAERIIDDIPSGYIYAYVEVDSDIIVEETDDHGSYPFVLKQSNGERPVLHLLSNRKKAIEAVRSKDGTALADAKNAATFQGMIGLAQSGRGSVIVKDEAGIAEAVADDINFSIDNTDVARQQIESGQSAQFDYNIVADLEDVFNDAGVEGTDIFEMMFEKSFKKKDAVNFEKVFDATFGTEIDYTQLFEDATTTEEAYEAAGTTTKEVNEFKKKFKGAARPKNVELIELVANYVNKRKELKGNDKAIAKLRENFVNEVRAKHRPLAPAKRSSIKPPASFKDIVSALNKGKVKIGIIGLTKSLPEGTKVGLRLDIPSMSYKGTAVVSIHDGRADLRKPNQDNNSSAKVLGYGQVARIKNVKFTTNVATAEKVGMGEAKTPFARMAGNWMNISTDDAIRLAEEAIKSDEWVEVTMNPASYSYFYDSVTGDKIVSAEEVVQVGAQVFAKNPETQNAMEVRYSIELNDADIPKQAHKKNIFQRLASGFVYTEMQKQARILFESKESQVTMSVRAGRKLARSIGKVANTFELIQMAADYMEGRNRTKITQELDRTNRGRKLLELLVQADAMVEGYANEIVEDPAFANLSMELKMAISMNAGSYLKTRYKFYTDKSYKITDKARRAAIKSEFDLITARTIATAKKAGLTEDQINTLLEDEYENIKQKAVDSIDSYINNIEEGRAMASQKGADIKIPSSSFQFKKDLPQHIQELLGKEKNPLTRFTATIEAQANILYKGQMVAGLLTAAKSDLGDFILDDEPPVSKAKLFKKVNDPYSLLNGKYVHNEILEIFDRAPLYESDKAWLQAYFSLLKQARKSKVIWNIPTWRKNLTGGWYFMMANGVLFNKNVASDIKNRLALTIGSDKFTADEFTEQLMEIMGKNGLIGTNINSQLVGINDAAYQFMLDGDEGALRSRTAKILNSISNADKWLQEKYSAVDDYTKLVIFRQEIESFAGKLYGKKYSELNAAQKDVVHADAAEFVKQNTPTFSRLPKFYDKVAVIPIFGDFASFQLESFRSFSANLRNAVKDMKTALNGVDENGNKLSPAQKKAYMSSAQKRFAGVALVTALRTATVIGAQEIFLDDDDEEIADDAKMVTPEWMKGQTLIVKSIDKDGNVRVYNYSSEDPYGTIGDITNGKDALESVFETFVRPNIAADYLFRMSKGEDVYGRKIFDKSDSNMQALGKFLGYTSKTFVTPPFISSSYRDVLKQNELTAKEFLTSPTAVGDLAKTITERSIIRDYKYNIIDQYRYSLMDLGKSKPISEAGSPERRMALLDEVREQLNAIERIAASKDNPTLRKDAIDYTKRYLKKEDWMYVFTGEKPE